MNDEIDPILVGETDDIEVGTVESFEHDDVNYAVYHLEPGFFCTQGNCNCEEKAPLSEAEIEGEELECVGCGRTQEEIRDWTILTDQEREVIMERLKTNSSNE